MECRHSSCSSIGLSKYCRNTPLLEAMKIHRISLSRDIAQLDLIRSFFKDTSRARLFYLHILSMHATNQMTGHVDLLSRVRNICGRNNISFLRYILDERYSNMCRSKMKKCFYTSDGLVDSVRQCLYYNDPNMINMLLVPF